ncbi:FadR family transcriptional regulator [Microaerobacter geothermalis]|uniref:FadR/GntR family transcriptional regulator n=1 Tax=Microaerobacter geothermalis TaxID=674972 RepID=UPI001F20F63F|nr:FadR/GntR family transcriptional regulator [Microaerobacter geothermalis]MCF6094087.1 FadR family transcriptional regulator [Microaerobacter geothermalis]
MALKPIRKKRLFEEIILAIEKYIEEENIKPGQKLPSENELTDIFNVSKTAVREAMSVLHANGIIETRPGLGIFLKEMEGETIAQRVTKNLIEKVALQEILEFRRGIEVEAAALAASRATDEDLYLIRQAHEKLVEANQNGLLGVEEDYMFHYSIILAAHNSIYKEVFENVSNKFEEGIRISKMQSVKVPGRFLESHGEHEEVIQSIVQRDGMKAMEAMRNHLLRNEKKIWRILNGDKM